MIYLTSEKHSGNKHTEKLLLCTGTHSEQTHTETLTLHWYTLRTNTQRNSYFALVHTQNKHFALVHTQNKHFALVHTQNKHFALVHTQTDDILSLRLLSQKWWMMEQFGYLIWIL